tara:strand:- start:284 stop:466 length:183 start_codon:yes stop_codon:yes gene_type:complete
MGVIFVIQDLLKSCRMQAKPGHTGEPGRSSLSGLPSISLKSEAETMNNRHGKPTGRVLTD